MSAPLKIIPLGGLGEIGLNMMAIEYDDAIMVVDPGNHLSAAQEFHDQGDCVDPRP
jgi:mRNA degradation ribonuclease J1/J2